MCVCVRMYMCAYVYLCVGINISHVTRIVINACKCARMTARTSACVHVHIHIHTYAYIHYVVRVRVVGLLTCAIDIMHYIYVYISRAIIDGGQRRTMISGHLMVSIMSLRTEVIRVLLTSECRPLSRKQNNYCQAF